MRRIRIVYPGDLPLGQLQAAQDALIRASVTHAPMDIPAEIVSSLLQEIIRRRRDDQLLAEQFAAEDYSINVDDEESSMELMLDELTQELDDCRKSERVVQRRASTRRTRPVIRRHWLSGRSERVQVTLALMVVILTVVGVLVSMTGCGVARAEDGVAPVVTMRRVIDPETRLSNRILLVCDVSCSMAPYEAELVSSVLSIAGQPTDEMEVGVIVFRGQGELPGKQAWARWGGVPEEGVSTGWARLPSEGAVMSLASWVAAYGTAGSTEPAEALQGALYDPQERLSVVLLSDGEFSTGQVTGTLHQMQMWRELAELGPAVVAVVGIGRSSAESKSLKALATAGKGGMWVRE